MSYTPETLRRYTPETFRRVVRLGWLHDTSASPDEWKASRPSIGQCAVTALLVQETFGGELLRVVNEGVSHYFNRLPDGSEVDLTRDQFDAWDPSPAEVRGRDYVLSFPATAERYERLKKRIGVVP
jgi:hypothetical protein